MESFLSQVADCLYREYGEGVSNLQILFPSRRARLFFSDTLAQLSDRPFWEPSFVSIDDIMEELSGLRAGDHIRLITELYKVYSSYHEEPFDSFYFWGEMLLADFDSVDKYRIDANMLFTNISDLKNLENDLSYLTPEQRRVILQFWKSFGAEHDFSEVKRRFVTIWQSLAAVYHDFRKRLEDQGMAYTGMIYRKVTDRIKAGETFESLTGRHYVIAGFNALSECEKILFDYLQKQCFVDFFWDYDHYYLDDADQEAGLFLRENIARFPQRLTFHSASDSFRNAKTIRVISAPSDTLQCKYVGEFLTETRKIVGQPLGKETVVVLTDENLLIPVLHSIPPQIERINVTMGYPLRQTLVYSFVERLISLQIRKRVGKEQIAFYHQDVLGLLTHPFLAEQDTGKTQELAQEIIARQRIYIGSEQLARSEFLRAVFLPTEGEWSDLATYLIDILGRISISTHGLDMTQIERDQRIEYVAVVVDHLRMLQNSLNGCGVKLSVQVFASLLRRMLQTVRIPYTGEPLNGVQVMGILETRNLDFEHVVILSVNDDTFPGNRATSFSFIPYNLRIAYGLPTPLHHEGVYAYYFYRLLQRARRIDLVYCSRSDEKSSGEQSRYIYQLEYESPHQILRRNIGLDVNLSANNPIVVAKRGLVAEQLQQFLQKGGPRLSPTSFYHYIECPLKFYFHSVARLKKDDEVTEEVDSPMFGTILHHAMEVLYTPTIGMPDPRPYLKTLIHSPQVDDAVNRAIREEYLRSADAQEEDYGGNLLLVKDIVCRYINTCILPFDVAAERFEVLELEKGVNCDFPFEQSGEKRILRFGGQADRIDRLENGTIRVVDYKTGAPHIEFRGIEALFSKCAADRSAAALQTLLYAMMLYHTQRVDVQPALYYVRQMNAKGYVPLLSDKGAAQRYVTGYLDYAVEFEQKLREVLGSLFDLETPFTPCEDSTPCQWCDYNKICRR